MTTEQEQHVKEWVAALRSGNYKQGKGHLQKNGEFCCLGVACDIYQKKIGDLDIFSFDDTRIIYDSEGSFLPKKVAEYFGLSSTGGVFMGGDFMSLYEMNDYNISFEDIANQIELKPQGLFKK